MGMSGFISLARAAGSRCIELDGRWLSPLSHDDLLQLGQELRSAGVVVISSDWLTHVPGETLESPIRCASALGATILRLHLTPVLEGARGTWAAWGDMVAHARTVLQDAARRASDAGLALAVENHQDFTSEELIAIADEAHVGLVLDTGNPFAVGEDPLAFVARAGDRIRHVHLKDYVAQFTAEGYRLVRCPVGEGCVPFAELVTALPQDITASIEPGALEARHIRLFTPEWWRGYPTREAAELAIALGRLQRHKLNESEDWRTPWERQESSGAIKDYEMAHINRSVENVRLMGLL
jgi:sugar phosphate isomerase/epimerase